MQRYRGRFMSAYNFGLSGLATSALGVAALGAAPVAAATILSAQSSGTALTVVTTAPTPLNLGPLAEADGSGLSGYADSATAGYQYQNVTLNSYKNDPDSRTTYSARQTVAVNGSAAASASSTGSDPLNLASTASVTDFAASNVNRTVRTRPFQSSDIYTTNLFTVTASSISSKTWNDGLDLQGASSFTNLRLTSIYLPNELKYFDGVYTPEANTVLMSAGWFSVIANAQEEVDLLVDGVLTRSLVTTALKVTITDWTHHGADIDSLMEVGKTSAAFAAQMPQAPVGGVPEPATWAMLISGFGLVGAAARRRTLALARA